MRLQPVPSASIPQKEKMPVPQLVQASIIDAGDRNTKVHDKATLPHTIYPYCLLRLLLVPDTNAFCDYQSARYSAVFVLLRQEMNSIWADQLPALFETYAHRASRPKVAQ